MAAINHLRSFMQWAKASKPTAASTADANVDSGIIYSYVYEPPPSRPSRTPSQIRLDNARLALAAIGIEREEERRRHEALLISLEFLEHRMRPSAGQFVPRWQARSPLRSRPLQPQGSYG